MILHTPTLFTAILVVSAVLAASLAFIGHRRSRHLFTWALALGVHAVAYGLFSLRGEISDFVSIVFGNTALAVSLALFGEGVFRFHDRRAPHGLLWAAPALALAVFPFMLDVPAARIATGSLLCSLQCLPILVQALRMRRVTPGRGQYILAGAALLVLVVMAERGVGVATGAARLASFTDSSARQTFDFVVVLVALLMLSIGIVVMTQERDEHELRVRQAREKFRSDVLEKISSGEALYGILGEIARGIERLSDDLRCDVELAGAALGSAAPAGNPAGGAAGAGISQPVLSPSRELLGTIRAHRPSGAAPGDAERALLREFANLASIAIERDRAAREIRQGEERYRRRVDDAHEGIAVLKDGRFALANPATLRILGRPADRVIGSDPLDAVHPGDRHVFLERRDGADWGTGAGPHPRCRIVRGDGSTAWIELKRTPIEWHGGPAALVMISDVTARTEAEAAVEEYRRGLERMVDARTAELSAAKMEAEAANVAKSTFLATMSHEIRTPMNAVVGFAHLLQRRLTDPVERDWLEKISKAARHLVAIINDILDFSKIEADRVALSVQPCDVREIVAHVLALMEPAAAAKSLRLDSRVDELPPQLYGDPVRLTQVLVNLVGNAVKFTEQGSVTVRASAGHATATDVVLRFEVDDTGIGIEPQALPGLFTPFQQADGSATRSHGGTGLGLAIVRRLARLMGGDTGVHSTPGVGSRFWFTARLARSPVQPATADAAATDPATRVDTTAAPRLRARGTRVLLAEDDPLSQEVGAHLLGDLGLDVDVAANGREAVRKVCTAAEPYALVLMDMQMPSMDGLAATRELRRLGVATPIVALTANAFETDRVLCREAGMDDFLSKPLDAQALDAVVARWIREGAPGAPGPAA